MESPESSSSAEETPRTRQRRSSREGQRSTKRRRWPWIVGGVVVFVAILGVFAAVFAAQALAVKDDLEAAKKDLQRVSKLVAAGKLDEVEPVVADLRARTASASSTVNGPLWSIAGVVPGVGANVDAVRRAAVAADILASGAVDPALQLASAIDFDNLSVEGGGIDIAPFRTAQGSLSTLSTTFASAQAEIEPIDDSALLPVVRDAVSELSTTVNDAAPRIELVNRYLPTLLGLLGDGGTREYLVIFQNNAEIRATGGNPAASMVVTVTDGRIELQDQANSQTFYQAGTAGRVHTDLPAETLALYPDSFTRYSQDYTMSPDFPTAAQLFQDLWSSTSGERFDGVIAIDPVVLASMLEVAGPVKIAGGEQITSENAVKVLLSDAYSRFPKGEQSDAFFAAVAKTTFEKLTEGSWNPVEMLEALEKSAAEQRVYLNFEDEKAQALARELRLDGALTEDNTDVTQVGVFANDYSVGKLEYHLSASVAASCDPAARTITTEWALTNSIPNGITVPYVLGARNGGFGLPPTTMMLDVLAFAPPGGAVLSVDPANGDVAGFTRSGVEKGHRATSVMVTVPQGETATYRATVQLPEGPLGPLQLRYSPTANPTEVSVDASCDSLFRAA